MKISERHLILRINIEKGSAACFYKKINQYIEQISCPFKPYSIDSQVIFLDLKCINEVIDHELLKFSVLIDKIAKNCGIDPEDLDLEVIDSESTEYIREPIIVTLEQGWNLFIASQFDGYMSYLFPIKEKTIYLLGGQAFGTGQHPSTKLAVRALLTLEKRLV